VRLQQGGTEFFGVVLQKVLGGERTAAAADRRCGNIATCT
jgi:hypothetical protein